MYIEIKQELCTLIQLPTFSVLYANNIYICVYHSICICMCVCGAERINKVLNNIIKASWWFGWARIISSHHHILHTHIIYVRMYMIVAQVYILTDVWIGKLSNNNCLAQFKCMYIVKCCCNLYVNKQPIFPIHLRIKISIYLKLTHIVVESAIQNFNYLWNIIINYIASFYQYRRVNKCYIILFRYAFLFYFLTIMDIF